MGVNASQHIAIRVADVERSARFYLDAFDGHYLTRPFIGEGEAMEQLMGGHPGLRVKVCILGFDQGVIELFEFLEPVHPPTAIDPPANNLIHWCLQVDDVEATLAKVLAAGGKTVRPLDHWGAATFVYCTDFDGNVFELLGQSMQEIATLTIEMFPEAAP